MKSKRHCRFPMSSGWPCFVVAPLLIMVVFYASSRAQAGGFTLENFSTMGTSIPACSGAPF